MHTGSTSYVIAGRQAPAPAPHLMMVSSGNIRRSCRQARQHTGSECQGLRAAAAGSSWCQHVLPACLPASQHVRASILPGLPACPTHPATAPPGHNGQGPAGPHAPSHAQPCWVQRCRHSARNQACQTCCCCHETCLIRVQQGGGTHHGPGGQCDDVPGGGQPAAEQAGPPCA